MRARLGMLPVAVDAVHEIRKARHRRREAAFGMKGRRELAWRDELMHVPAHAIELPAVSPELRRPSRHDRAAQAVGALADPPSVFPQHVRRTDQPVLVRGVELERRRTGRRQRERVRPEQRDVVEVDHVVPALRQQRLQRRRLEQRPACLLRQQRRQPAEPAAQPVHVDVRMIRHRRGWLGRVQQVVAVEAVHHVHVMPVVSQCMSQPVEVDRVTAEAPRRVERGQVQDIQGARHDTGGRGRYTAKRCRWTKRPLERHTPTAICAFCSPA